MSVDIHIGDFSGNYTHNVSGLWHDHLRDGDETGFMALDGKTGEQAFALMAEAFERIDATCFRVWSPNSVGEPRFSAMYDAPNGWGSAIGGLIFMARVMAACGGNPSELVEVSV